jgi:putative colanic acid biosynthesis UDP-glucose lipid carrier transferase
MSRDIASIKLPLKRKTAKPNATIISFLNKSHNSAGNNFLYRIAYTHFTPLNIAAVHFIQVPLDKKINGVIKRTMDIVLSVLVITCILTWLIPLLFVIIKLESKGPLFFLQQRVKQNGKLFTCIKFRSMQLNAAADIVPATVNDKRITATGRFLRKTFIDELPQFFNVLWGDMSVIGPRPHMVSEHMLFEETISYYKYREKIKPGITGLAQIMGLEGSAESFQRKKDRTDVDIFYLRHWSVKLDCIILYRTLYKMTGL